MKYSYVSPTLLALACSTVAQVVNENNKGVVYAAGPVVTQTVETWTTVNKYVVVPPGQSSAYVAPHPNEKLAVVPTPQTTPISKPQVQRPQEKVYVAPSSNPNQAPSGLTAPVAVATPPPSSGGGAKSNSGQICINFSGGDFHFANAGSWGTKTGHGASDASQCFGIVAGGAMFICESECNSAGDAAPAKYTKLECNFAGSYPNCDISLVDGYSLPLECTIPGGAPEKIGGLTDLASIAGCPSTGGDNTCPNTQGYTSGITTSPPVNQFFLNANTNDPKTPGPAGNYCVWQTCSGPSDSFWNSATNPTISCQVGTRQAHKKREDGGIETRNISNVEAREVDSSLESHVRRHTGGAHSHARAHVRDIKAVLA